MHSRLKKLFAAAVVACPLAWSAHSEGAPISYGTFVGTNVTYVDVTEDSTTDPSPPNAPLFGNPTLSDDSLSFNPSSFGASASGGASDITDGTLAATLMTSGTKRINKVTFAEAGDYTLAGGAGTTATTASVGAAFVLKVIEVDGSPITPVSILGNMPMSPSGGTYDFVNDPRGPAAIWSGSVTFDITGALVTQGIFGLATKVTLNLDNSLSASSEPGTFATIKKKEFNGTTITVDTIVPEPASLAWLALGAACLTRKRK